MRVMGKTAVSRMSFRLAINRLSLGLAVISALGLGIMTLLMLTDAIARKVVGTIPGAFEMSLAFLVMAVFFPQAYTQMRRGHVAIDVITSRFSAKTNFALGIPTSLLGFAAYGLLAWLAGGRAWEATLVNETQVGMVDFPVWVLRWFVPLGVGALALEFLLAAIENFVDWRKR